MRLLKSDVTVRMFGTSALLPSTACYRYYDCVESVTGEEEKDECVLRSSWKSLEALKKSAARQESSLISICSSAACVEYKAVDQRTRDRLSSSFRGGEPPLIIGSRLQRSKQASRNLSRMVNEP